LNGVFYDNGTKEGTLVTGGGGGDVANYQELPQVSTTGNITNYAYVD
jgi:hypothetical protein